jgi:hypothetical protein
VRSRRLREVTSGAAVRLAGPVLIVAAVLVALRSVAFLGVISAENPDVLALWLPTYCFLGESLGSGHLPAWNPHVMGGLPFASDPQSGWLNLPAMSLFGVLSCGSALRAYVVLQPVLAGLGLFLFLRSEGVGRSAATLGGLGLAVSVAASRVALSLPFSSSLAWTAVTLAAVSGYLRSESWPARLGWLAGAAIAWGQLAVAHLSEGLVIGTMAVAAYLIARGVAAGGGGRRELGRYGGLVGLLVIAAALLNLAYLLPRLAYLPRTSIALGYEELRELAASLSGLRPVEHLPGEAIAPQWPLRMALAPGLYLGAAPLLLSFAWWPARNRALGAAFTVYGVVSYVLAQRGVARALSGAAGALPFGDFYLKAPSHFAFGLLLAVPVLGALALDAWTTGRAPPRERLPLVAAGVLVWVLLPLVLGAAVSALVPLLVGAAAAGLVLAMARRQPGLLVAVPILLAVELSLAGLLRVGDPDRVGRDGSPPLQPAFVRVGPEISIGAYLEPGQIVRSVEEGDEGRFLSLDPARWDPRGYHVHQGQEMWPFLAAQQSMVHGLEEAQGYNSSQLLRFWTFVRAADPKRIKYNAAGFTRPPPIVLDLLQVRWVIAPAGGPPEAARGAVAADEGRYALYELVGPPDRVSVVTSWEVVGSAEEALGAVLAPGFDPARTVVVEGDPGLVAGTGPVASPPSTGRATYEPLGPQQARVEVDTAVPALVLIRNSFDPNWRATVDGEPVSLLAADSLIQAVPVPAGRHVVELRYDDPWIGWGLLASAAAFLGLGAAMLVLRRRSRD